MDVKERRFAIRARGGSRDLLRLETRHSIPGKEEVAIGYWRPYSINENIPEISAMKEIEAIAVDDEKGFVY